MGRNTSQAKPKRFGCVLKSSDDSAAEISHDSRNGDGLQARLRRKVRSDFSIWKLKKNSEYFKIDEDHIYSKSSMETNDQTPKERESISSVEDLPQLADVSFKSQSEGCMKDRTVPAVIRRKKRSKCCSKSALMARLNRERKKQYMTSLENCNADLQKQNDEILQKIGNQEKIIAALQNEVVYLKSILANSKEISQILNNIRQTTGLPVTTSLKYQDGLKRNESSEDFCIIKTENNNQSSNHIPFHQAHVKKVTSGSNFPILQKDVYLDSCIDLNDNENGLNHDYTFMESFPSDANTDFNKDILGMCDYDLTSSLFDTPLQPISNNLNEENNCLVNHEAPVKTFLKSDPLKSNVGVCLHINKSQISLELCSICNSRAHYVN